MGERGKKEQGGTGGKDSPIIMFSKIPQGRKPSPTRQQGQCLKLRRYSMNFCGRNERMKETKKER